MQSKIVISGFKELEKELSNLNDRIDKISKEVYLEEVKKNVKEFSDTDNLYNSFTLTDSGIMSKADYSKIQDEGGKIMITEKMRKKMWALFYSTGQEKYKRMALNKDKFITIKAKHYTKIKDYILNREIEKRIDNITKRI